MKIGLRIFIFTLVLIFLLPICVFAATYPEDMQIDAIVNVDGSMTVEETIVWEIEERINGVYRDILCFNEANKLNSAEEIYVEEIIVNGREYYYSEDELQNGVSGMYNLNRIEGGAQIKIFHPTDEYNITTVIKYTLTNVVVKYNDVAELYWNFIGKDWDSGIENVTITITLPETSKTLKVFGHGPLNGYSEIIDDKTVRLSVDYLRSSEAVDARVIFDRDIVLAGKQQDKDMYEEIMAKELELAKQADARRERATIFTIICWVISITLEVIMVGIYIWILSKRKKCNLYIRYYRELPEDYGVPVMNYLLHKYHKDNENMLATLMDLVRKKYIKIHPITKEGKTKPVDYELQLIKEDLSGLNEIEKHYIQKLIFVNCTSIKLKELKKKNTDSISAREKAGKAFEKWQTLIEKEFIARKLKRTGINKYINKSIGVAAICFIITIILFIICCIAEIIEAAVGIFMVLLTSIFIMTWIPLKVKPILEDNDKSLEHKVKWEAFKRFLKDFSKMEEKDYGSIVLWEHYLVYAIGLGIADKVLKQLKDIYPEITGLEDTYSGLYYSSSFSSFSSSFNSVSTGAFTASSSTGSSGGFSGGGGGRRWPAAVVADFSSSNIIRYIGKNTLYIFCLNVEKYSRNIYNILEVKSLSIRRKYGFIFNAYRYI